MSLKIWLPLNGNIENQGLADVTITNNGATVDNNGKIGKCYSFNGSSNYIQLTNSIIEGKKPFTFSVWYKTTSGNSYYPIISVGTSSKGFTIHGSVNRLEGGNGTNHFNSSNHITAVSWGMWAHLAVTYDGTKIQSYLNGVPNANSLSWTYGLGTGNTTIKIGHFWGGYFKGYINDFRIYDECLSADQIKEISRGMVLHYKMCQPERSENLLANGAATEITCRSKNPDYPLKAIRAALENNTQYTLSFDAKSDNGLGTFYCSLANGGSSQIYFATKIKPTTKYKHFVYIATRGTQTTNNILFAAYYDWSENANVTDTIHIKNVKLEKGSNPNATFSPPPTETLNWGTIEYDGSGFKNHGTVTGNVTLSADSPRYTGSYKFGTNNYITTTSTGNYIKSATFWAKDAGSVPSDGLVFRDQNSGLAFGIQSGNLITGAVGGPAGSSSESVSVSGAKYTANIWHFFACVNDNGTQRLYMDGIQISTGTGTGKWSQGSPTNSLNVGGRAGSSYWPGYISDFKMYVTVLSATDVQELYKLGRV